MTGLLVAKQVARAANIEVVRSQFEARSELVERL
jgi:hypothetical protein